MDMRQCWSPLDIGDRDLTCPLCAETKITIDRMTKEASFNTIQKVLIFLKVRGNIKGI